MDGRTQSPGASSSSSEDDMLLRHVPNIQPEPQQPQQPWRPQEPPLPYPPLLMIQDADTLAYIDPPPQSSTSRYRHSVPHRIRSAPLLDTGSSYFRKFFTPRVQTRTVKHRGFERGLPDGIKYVIDLTPPSEDEEAVIFVTELSCPQGIRAWTQFARRWELPLHCVGGQDEDLSQKASAVSQTGTPQPQSDPENAASTTKLPAEYSAMRHRIGIEHILQALQGLQPAINTPCKFWTFFTLAHLFDVATVPSICDLILAWLYHSTNSRLIETQPEVAYRIACGTRCANLCRESFAILVGEEALLLLANSHEPPMLNKPRQTLHGRLRESLDDTETQRVEYASKSFMEYMLDQFIQLTGVEMHWFLQLPTIQKVLQYAPKNAEEQSAVNSLITMLKDFVRGRIVLKLVEAGATTPTVEFSLAEDVYPSSTYKGAYERLPYLSRIMCKTFWRKLLFESFTGVYIGQVPLPDLTNASIAEFGSHLPALKSQANAMIRTVFQSDVDNIIMRFNDLLGLGQDTPQQSSNGDGSGEPAVHWETYQHLDAGSTDPFTTTHPRIKEKNIFLNEFTEEVRLYVYQVVSRITQPGKTSMAITETVGCLTDEEFKYLPLWAGGNDDGSGGVFNDQDIPAVETGGFSQPGPSIHTGSTMSSCGSSSIVGASEFESTVQGASHRTTDGYQSTDVMSLDSDFELVQNRDTHPGVVSSQVFEDTLSIDLESSADEDGDPFDTASDSSETVVMGNLDSSDSLSDFEDLTMESDGSAH